MNKIELYAHALHVGIVFVKNSKPLPLFKGEESKKTDLILELLHNIPTRMYSQDYTDADRYFVEHDLKEFVSLYPDDDDPVFLQIMSSLYEVYCSVNTKREISWGFDEQLKKKITLLK